MRATKANAVTSMIHFVFSRICRIMASRLLGLLELLYGVQPVRSRGRSPEGRGTDNDNRPGMAPQADPG